MQGTVAVYQDCPESNASYFIMLAMTSEVDVSFVEVGPSQQHSLTFSDNSVF